MVTGASSGIGEAACAQLARAAAKVQMVVRNRERGEQARARVVDATGSDRVELHICDVSSLASVREFATAFSPRVRSSMRWSSNAGVMPFRSGRGPRRGSS